MKTKVKEIFIPLTRQEMKDINGGNGGLIGIVDIMLMLFGFGYDVGKDRAEADRRNKKK